MELLELFNFIMERFPGIIAPNLFIASASVWIVVKIRAIRHPRYIFRFITFVFIIFLVFNTIALKLTDIFIASELLILTAIYSLLACMASKGPILYSNWKLEYLRNQLSLGYGLDNELLFDKEPCYMIDFAEKYRYLMLKAEHFSALEKFADAYEVYRSIDERKLFDKEKIDLLRKKAFMLYSLGDMNRAAHYLGRIKDESEPNYLMLKSMIAENEMDFDSAGAYLQKALNLTSDAKEPLLRAMIYNNYGRLRFMEGNYTDAVLFYRQSCEAACSQKNRKILHISYQNLVHTCLLKGDKEKGLQYFLEYETLIANKTLFDMREELTLRVEIARQNKSSDEVSAVILEGYQKIRSLLTNKSQKIFDVSVLRMMFNNKMNIGIVMEQIYDNIDYYFTLKMPEKYFALKEINISLREIGFPHCHKYALVNKLISDYMENDAIKDIEACTSRLRDYDVHQRCSMELEKACVHKEWIRPYNFESIYSSMNDIKDIYHKNGMMIEAIFMDLAIADECFAPENFSGGQIKPLQREKLAEHAGMAAESLSKLKKYPRVAEGSIRLAIYYMALNEREKAEKYFNDFEDSKVNVRHFAFWIQSAYEGLYREFKSVK